MKIVLQRVKESQVVVDNDVVGSIGYGYMALVGFCEDDNEDIVNRMIDKMINLRVFSDQEDKMNLSLLDIDGEVLSISQFTLYADCKKGRRPSFIQAMKPERSSPMYDYFNHQLRQVVRRVETGIFGADMKVSLLNDGPVTIILDSSEILR